jgi:hypothetical protein
MLDYPTAGGAPPSPAALAARATRVPHRTDTRGTERTTTVSLAPPMSWPAPLGQHERIPRTVAQSPGGFGWSIVRNVTGTEAGHSGG